MSCPHRSAPVSGSRRGRHHLRGRAVVAVLAVIRSRRAGREHRLISRVQLIRDAANSAVLSPVQRERLLERLAGRLIDGVLTIAASEHRALELRNRDAARARLVTLVADAISPPAPPRRPTKPSRGSKERRLRPSSAAPTSSSCGGARTTPDRPTASVGSRHPRDLQDHVRPAGKNAGGCSCTPHFFLHVARTHAGRAGQSFPPRTSSSPAPAN